MKKFLALDKRIFIIGFLLILLFFATRLFNLLIIPIFTDEAIYLRWSQIMAYDASLRYLPLADGKPPLFMWLTSFLMRLLDSQDPLFVGRLTSVLAGFFGLAGIVFTSFVLFKNRLVTLISVLFYLLVPFTFFYDRIALADSLLAALATWSVGLGVVLARTLRLDMAMIQGLVIGFGLLTKSPAIFFILVQPLFAVFLRPKSQSLLASLFKYALLLIVVVIFSQGIYSVLRLFPLFHMVSQKNAEFIIPVSEFLSHPFALFPGNFKSLITWEFVYLTPLVSLLTLLGLVTGILEKSKPKLVLALIFAFHLLAISSFNKVIYVRYLLTFTPLLLILAASAFLSFQKYFKRPFILVAALFLVLSYPLFVDLKLLTDPVHAPTPKADAEQYLHAWPAGFGVTEVRSLLAKEANTNPKLVIITEGTFGLMPYALELYQSDYPNLEIIPIWPFPNELTPKLKEKIANTPTYVLLYQRQDVSPSWPLTEILRFRQGEGKDHLRLYRVNL